MLKNYILLCFFKKEELRMKLIDKICKTKNSLTYRYQELIKFLNFIPR